MTTTLHRLRSGLFIAQSFLNSKNESEVQEILKSLLVVQSKLKRCVALKANVSYELGLFF